MNITDKYKGKYRIASTRLATWDYGSNAPYYITICTSDRKPAFGEVADGRVALTPLGQAVWDCWYAIPDHFPFVLLDEFVAMPNHVHGIVIINKQSPNVDAVVETQDIASLRQSPNVDAVIKTQYLASLRPSPNVDAVIKTQYLASLRKQQPQIIIQKPIRTAIPKFGVYRARIQNRGYPIR